MKNLSRSRSHYLSATALGVSLLLAQPARAAEAGGSSADQQASPADIIVTARRVEERLQDVPISITVYNQEQLNNRNVLNAADLAATTPSLNVNPQFGGDNTTFSIRGFIQDIGTAPTVGVYFADVVSPRGGGGSVPAGDGAGAGSLFDLQNVQVLNGPQGTLQGRNTTGGAVMLVPQKPTGKLEGYVQGSLGNYNLRGVQAVLNVPVNDRIRMRLGIDRQARDGYIKNRSGIGPADFEDVNYTALRASLVADLTPDIENYTIASFSHSKTNGAVQKLIGASPVGTLFPFAYAQIQQQQALGYYDVLQSMPDASSKTRQWQVINTTTWKASDALTIKNIVSYAEYKQYANQSTFATNWTATTPQLLAYLDATITQTNAGLAASGYPTLPTLADVAGWGQLPNLTNAITADLATYGSNLNYAALHTAPGLPTSAQSTFTEELQFQGRGLDNKLNWQGGVYYERSKPLGESGFQTQTYTDCAGLGLSLTLSCTNPLAHAVSQYLNLIGNPSPSPIPLAGGYNYQVMRNSFENIGLYGQASYALTDKLKATAGFRYTWDKQVVIGTMRFTDANNVTICMVNPTMPVATGCAERHEQKSRAPTWLLNLDYKPNEDILLYAKWARGYRTGGVKADVPASLGRFNPERLDNFEVGLKSSFRGTISGVFNLNGFYNKFSNQQVMLGLSSLGNVPPASTPYNLGKSRLWGIEASTSLNLFRGFTLDAAYTYLNTKVQSLLPVPSCGTYMGYPLVCVDNVPQYIAAVTSVVGQPIKQSPKNRYTVTGTYVLPLDARIGKLSLSATFTHTDSQRSTYSYGTLQAMSIPTFVNSSAGVVASMADLGVLPATNLLDLAVNWNSIGGTPLDLTLFATNVTKQRYYSWVPGQIPLGLETGSLGAPRMYGMRLKARF